MCRKPNHLKTRSLDNSYIHGRPMYIVPREKVTSYYMNILYSHVCTSGLCSPDIHIICTLLIFMYRSALITIRSLALEEIVM